MPQGTLASSVFTNLWNRILEKDKDGNIRVMEKRWDLTNPFEPSLVVADTKNNCYGTTVEWYIWHYRKHINAKWFNDKD